MMLRVVFDTSTIVSALLFKNGKLAWMRAHWQQGHCQPLLCRDTALELLRVLSYSKFQRIPTPPNEALADYFPFCETVEISKYSTISCRDKKDQVFLNLAHCGHAHVLVSSDQDLLTLAGQTEFAIESPEVYRQRIHP